MKLSTRLGLISVSISPNIAHSSLTTFRFSSLVLHNKFLEDMPHTVKRLMATETAVDGPFYGQEAKKKEREKLKKLERTIAARVF